MEIALLIWIVCGIGAAIVAGGRGGNGCLWFGLGLLFGPFGLAFSFAAGDDRKCPQCMSNVHRDAQVCPKCQSPLGATTSPVVEDESRSATKKCPDCAEDVKSEARKCRFCGYLFNPESNTAAERG
jgi:hypothetical protein